VKTEPGSEFPVAIRLSQLETECIKVLWQKQAATVSEVKSAISRPLAYTTIMTVLDRLLDKGAVVRHKQGRSFRYSPALDLNSARLQAVHKLVENLFDKDPRALIQFVQEQRLPEPTQLRARERKPSSAPASLLRAEIDDSLL
jgi:predicted transcriptional regulator